MEELELIGYDLYKKCMKKIEKLMLENQIFQTINAWILIKFLDLIHSYISSECNPSKKKPRYRPSIELEIFCQKLKTENLVLGRFKARFLSH